MARLMAASLRDSARTAMLAAGGRGFMRFAGEGDALLATDAVRRCADADTLADALRQAGFVCCQRDGLLLLTPQDDLLRALCTPSGRAEIDWDRDDHPVRSLAHRWLCAPDTAFSAAGRRLVIDTLRLTGMPGADVPGGSDALRAQAAVMLRRGDRSGMRAAGAVLLEWCVCRKASSGIKRNNR